MSKRERFIAAMAFSVMMLCWSPQVVWAQKELDRPVSVSVRHGNVSTVLAAIRKATGMDILYSGDVLKTWPKVTIDAKGQSARALLDELMSQTGWRVQSQWQDHCYQQETDLQETPCQRCGH